MGCKTAAAPEPAKKLPASIDLSSLLTRGPLAGGSGNGGIGGPNTNTGAVGALVPRSYAGNSSSGASGAPGPQQQQEVPVQRVQMIAMSATMGNVEELAKWLGGSIYRTSFRPVPLIERIKAGNELLDSEGRLLATLPSLHKSSAKSPDPDPDHMILLCQQALRQGQQVLVFCASKYACLQSCKALVDAFTVPYKTPFDRSGTGLGTGTGSGVHAPVVTHMNLRRTGTGFDGTATTIAPQQAALPQTGADFIDTAKRQQLLDQRQALLRDLQAENPHLEESLRCGILNGVAYHNAGAIPKIL